MVVPSLSSGLIVVVAVAAPVVVALTSPARRHELAPHARHPAPELVPRALLRSACVGLPLLAALTRGGAFLGLYSPDVGLALLVLSAVVVFVALARWCGERWRAVTEEGRALERELARYQRRLERICASEIVGVGVADADGVVREANDTLLAMLGYSPADLTAGALHAPRQDGARSHRIAGSRPLQEDSLLHRDGSPVPVLAWTAELDAEGSSLLMVSDLRESKRQQMELRESELRFSRLNESGLVGIVTGDERDVVLDANEAFLGMIGYTREDLTAGRIRFSRMTPPEHGEGTRRAFEQVGERGFSDPWEKEYLRKDGARVPVLIGVAALDQRRNIGFVADLTKLREAEKALRRTEDQLRHSQKMDAVGRLAGGVAHDFNNLLSVILSYTELLLEDTEEGAPARADLDEIARAARRATELTRQLLLFSRQQVVAPRVADLNDVLDRMDRMLKPLLGEDVSLLTRCARDLGRVLVDVGNIEQVIMNLVVNARDAMEHGGRITIQTANVDLDERYARAHLGTAPGPYVMLAVSDTGVGIDQETQRHVFEPFFTTKGPGKGTGLGLSTVFGIVKQSGGSIWLESQVGRGTTFRIYLPRVDADADREDGRDRHELLRGTETVLLLEDEDQVRAVSRSILSRHGYEVLEASIPSEAVALASSHTQKIDLLLTDVVMPEMSGPEVAKQLLGLHPEMRVLYMSGYTDDAVLRRGVLTSATAFLQKPLSPDSLARKVREVLDSRR